MSDSHEMKTAAQHNAPLTGHSELHDEHPVDFNSYLRRCGFIFVAILCAVALMIWISYLPTHYSWALKSALILLVASCNAFVVAGFLMHLLSEKKMIYTILAFTVVFVICLFWLTLYAMQDFPLGTTTH
jgi:heme/copper-type cytochrome/quinol oxidase subunit 4